MTEPLVFVAVLVAAFVQSLTGFGFAAMIMPLVTMMVGLPIAAPLVALAGLTVYTTNLLRHRRAIHLGEVLRLGAASAVGVPIGIWLLTNVDESVVKRVLGLILIAYGLYTLVGPTVSCTPSRRWAYAAGFVAGCLGGAYNTPGPPVILYGSSRRWPRDRFRAVLQTFFAVNATMVVTSHLLAHHVTTTILTLFAISVPAILLGILIGSRLDPRVDAARFRTLVTVMILLLGLLLVLNVGQHG
jgi:uncharacterized membrane protein YfcA